MVLQPLDGPDRVEIQEKFEKRRVSAGYSAAHFLSNAGQNAIGRPDDGENRLAARFDARVCHFFKVNDVAAQPCELDQVFGRNRVGEQETLTPRHADLAEKITLCLGFDTLSHEIEAKTFSHRRRRARNAQRATAGSGSVNEASIEFQLVDRKILEIAQSLALMLDYIAHHLEI